MKYKIRLLSLGLDNIDEKKIINKKIFINLIIHFTHLNT